MFDVVVPRVCPRCGGGPVVAVRWDPVYLSARDRAEVAAGRAILAASGREGHGSPARRGLPRWGCLGCVPGWAELHRLAQQDLEWWEATQAAIEAQDFEEALRLRDLRHAARPGQAALSEPLLRCLAPKPPAGRLDPRWLTADVTGLAAGIDRDGAFDRLPILADALVDAGCTDEAALAHCREGGPHVRGCWVIDSALGRESAEAEPSAAADRGGMS